MELTEQPLEKFQKYKIRFFIFSLAFTEVVSWGSIYFTFSLFVNPMKHDLSWRYEDIIFPFSIALLVSGVTAVIVGRWIDKRGGYLFLMGGSFTTSVLFFVWSSTNTYAIYCIVWLMLGITRRIIYSSVYSIIIADFKDKAPRIVTSFTLFSAFSSTLFIPITSFSIEIFGWRNALFILGGLNLLCVLFQFLAKSECLKSYKKNLNLNATNFSKNEHDSFMRVFHTKHFWGLTIAFMSTNIISTALCVHLLPILLELGYEMNIIVTTMTLSGPSQIIIRLLLLKNTKKFSMRTICITSMLFQFFAVLILSILSQEFWLLVSFTILYGLGTGMATIVGILASLEFFGASNYNLIQGALHIPATIARAAAPILIASILAVTGGYRPIILLFLIITGISSLVFIFLTNSKQISPCKMTSSES